MKLRKVSNHLNHLGAFCHFGHFHNINESDSRLDVMVPAYLSGYLTTCSYLEMCD